MKKDHKKGAFLPLVMVLGGLLLGSCPSGEGELFYVPNPPDKIIRDDYGNITDAFLRTALYVDTEQSQASRILSTVPGYVLEETGVIYFDYVILSGAFLKQGDSLPYLGYSEALRGIAQTHIKPLRDRGIKVLLGVKGGGDGISFGSLTKDEQALFAQECANFCKYYGLDGVEFYDVQGENSKKTPYPARGKTFWDGKAFIDIPLEDIQQVYERSLEKGAGNFTNMMSHLIESLGASSSFQGDIPPDATERTPILVREVNFGKHLPDEVPRYAFASTLSCFSYLINEGDSFGAIQKGAESGESLLEFVSKRMYAPVMINLGSIDRDTLIEYSKRIGIRNYYANLLAEDPEDYQEEEPFNSEYGLVYYTNLQVPSDQQTEQLSITAREVFGHGVVYQP